MKNKIQRICEILDTDMKIDNETENLCSFMNEVLENVFFEDSPISTYLIYCQKMKTFSLKIFDFWIENFRNFSEENELKFLSFFRVYFTKQKYSHLTPFIEKTYQLFHRIKVEGSIEDEVFQRFLGILKTFVNSNLIVPKNNFFVMSGLDQTSIIADFNEKFNSNNLFLNKNFSLIMNLTIDLEFIESSENPLYLFNYKSDIPESGYGVYILKNELKFFYKWPNKTLNSSNEFIIFPNLSFLKFGKFVPFTFSCKFNSIDTMSALTITLGDQKFEKVFNFINFFPNSMHYRLYFLTGTPSYLSSIMILNRSISDNEFIKMCNPSFTQAFLNQNCFENIFLVFDPVIFKTDLIFLLHSFNKKLKHPSNETFEEDINGVVYEIEGKGSLISLCRNHHSYALKKTKFFQFLCFSFMFVNSSKSLTKLLRILLSLVQNLGFMELYNFDSAIKAFQLILLPFLHTKSLDQVNESHIEFIVSSLNEIPNKFKESYIHNLLMSFHFLNIALKSENQIKCFFDCINKVLNENFSLIQTFDFNSLFRHAILFLNEKSKLSVSKSLHLLKLVGCSMSVVSIAKSFEIQKLSLLIFKKEDLNSVFQIILLKILKEHIKINGVFEPLKSIFLNSLWKIIYQTTDACVLRKIVNIAFMIDDKIENQIIFHLRKKLQGESNVRTKKFYFELKNKKHQIGKSTILIEKLMTLVFEDLNKKEVFLSSKFKLLDNHKMNLLIDSCFLAEMIILEKVLYSVQICLKETKSEFVEKIDNTNFLTWLIFILFDLNKKNEESQLFSLVNDILKTYCKICFNLEKSISFLNQICENVYFYSLEFNEKSLKYAIFRDILNEFTIDDYLKKKDEFIVQFLLALMKFYCINFRQERSEEEEESVFDILIEILSTTININPSMSLISRLLDILPKEELFSHSLVKSLTFQSFSKSKKNHLFGSPFNTTFKLIHVILIDLMEYIYASTRGLFVLQNLIEFLNALFYRILNFLENNKSKLSVDKIRNAETAIYQLFSFFIKKETRRKNVEKIIKSVNFFSENKIFELSVAKTMILPIQNKLNHETNTQSVDFSSFVFDALEYKDSDFLELKENYLLESIGIINQTIESDSFKKSADYSQSEAEEIHLNYSKEVKIFEKEFENLINFLIFKQNSKIFKLKKKFKKTISELNRIDSSFFKQDLFSCFGFGQPFELPFFSSINPPSSLHSQNSYITSEFKTPFVKIKLKETEKYLLITPPLIQKNEFNFQECLESLNKHVFCCNIIRYDRFEKVYCFVHEEKKTVYILSNGTNEEEESFFESSEKIKESQLKNKKLNLTKMKKIERYKFLGKETGCIFLKNNRKHFILNFQNPEKAEKFFIKVFALINQRSFGNFNKYNKSFWIEKLNIKWKENEITNYEFLMRLNYEGCRSFKDYSQYPILPILMTSFENKVVLRDLQRSATMAGDPVKVTTISSNLNCFKIGTFDQKYYLDCYYSHPTSVLCYLERIHPFQKAFESIPQDCENKNQNKFVSISEFLKSFRENAFDWREAVPEMFYSPEMFINYNNYQINSLNKSDPGHFILPEICSKNPDRFVFYMMQMLESTFSSINIHTWIALVFGHKQKGEEAKKQNNQFPLSFYEDDSKLAIENDELLEKSNKIDPFIEKKKRYFCGSVPKCIFYEKILLKEVSKKFENIVSSGSHLKYFIRVRNDDKHDSYNVILMKTLSEKRQRKDSDQNSFLIVYEDKAEVWNIKNFISSKNSKNPFNLKIENTFQMEKIKFELEILGQLKEFKDTVELYAFGKLIYGGFPNGAVVNVSFTEGRILQKQILHDYPINHILLTPKKILVSSDINGIVIISKLNTKTDKLIALNVISNGFGESVISLKMVSNDKQLFSVNTSNSIEIHSTDAPHKFLFQIFKKDLKILSESFHSVFFSFAYLNVLIIYDYDEQFHYFTTVNLSGKIICTFQEKTAQKTPFKFFKIIRDEFFKDHIACVSEKGDIMFVDFPFFQYVKHYKSYQNSKILRIEIVNNSRSLLLIDDHKNIDVLQVCESKED
jgi:hypothetical protein